MKKAIFAVLMVFALLAGGNMSYALSYKIQKHDKLEKISGAFGVSVDEILQANPKNPAIKSKDKILHGFTIVIPNVYSKQTVENMLSKKEEAFQKKHDELLAVTKSKIVVRENLAVLFGFLLFVSVVSFLINLNGRKKLHINLNLKTQQLSALSGTLEENKQLMDKLNEAEKERDVLRAVLGKKAPDGHVALESQHNGTLFFPVRKVGCIHSGCDVETIFGKNTLSHHFSHQESRQLDMKELKNVVDHA